MSSQPSINQQVTGDNSSAFTDQEKRYVGGSWKPGQSGNPLGRPKSALVSQSLRRKIAEVCEKGDQTTADMLANRILKIALQGKDNNALTAITEIRDTTEG